MAASKLQSVRQILSFMTKGPGFDRVLDKLVVTAAGEGRCVCELKLAMEHQNRNEGLHGGLTATLVDVVSTTALMTKEGGMPGVSVDLSVSYLRSAKIGEELIIEADTVKLGKTLAFLKVEIKNKKDGKLIATGSHTKYVGTGSG